MTKGIDGLAPGALLLRRLAAGSAFGQWRACLVASRAGGTG